MADEKPNIDEAEDCTIGMSASGEVAIVTIPIRKYALDEMNGNALIYGKMREVQAHIMQMAASIRKKKADAGLVKPNGAVSRQVN